jgi:hypothetical protein
MYMAHESNLSHRVDSVVLYEYKLRTLNTVKFIPKLVLIMLDITSTFGT